MLTRKSIYSHLADNPLLTQEGDVVIGIAVMYNEELIDIIVRDCNGGHLKQIAINPSKCSIQNDTIIKRIGDLI